MEESEGEAPVADEEIVAPRHKPWWRLIRFYVLFLICAGLTVAGLTAPSQHKTPSNSSELINHNTPVTTTTTAPTTTTAQTGKTTTTTTAVISQSGSDDGNFYVNAKGQRIPIENPAGDATGVCRDGTYTHALNHMEACKQHQGVDHWL